MSAGHAPQGWPAQVLPPDVEDWESSAAAWFLDYGDPAWREDAALRGRPVLLARFARGRARADVVAARALWIHARELLEDEEDVTVAAVRGLLEREGPVLVARATAAELVAAALEGARWTPKL